MEKIQVLSKYNFLIYHQLSTDFGLEEITRLCIKLLIHVHYSLIIFINLSTLSYAKNLFIHKPFHEHSQIKIIDHTDKS